MRQVGLRWCAYCVVSVVTILVAPAVSRAGDGLRPRIVRPPDDRTDYFAIDAELQAIGDSVCAFIPADTLIQNADGTFEINARTLEEDQGPLCAGERFANQPTAATCTGTLVAPDIVVTAGHCLDDNGMQTPTFNEFYFVFDYAVREDGVMPSTFSADQVYRGSEILGLSNVTDTADDWAVVRLERPVTGRMVVPVRSTGVVAVGQSIVAIGFGAGLPMKFSGNATVQAIDGAGFEADLDIIEGNSGGPIVDPATGLLEGVLSSDLAVDDFYQDGDCFRATECPGDPICDDGFTLLASVMIPQFQTTLQAAINGNGTGDDGDNGDGPGNDGGAGDDDDADGDGISDFDDFCPDTAADAAVDADGCALDGSDFGGGLGGGPPCGAVGMVPMLLLICGLGLLRQRR